MSFHKKIIMTKLLKITRNLFYSKIQ